MKKIYKEEDNGTKTLVAYDYNGVVIELDYTESNSYYHPWKRDGYIVPKLKEVGKASWHETLKEAKEWIDKYLINKGE